MKRPLRLLLFASLIPVGLVTYFLIKNSRAATASPVYNVIRKCGGFEIRDYPALTLITTPMRNAGDDGSSFGNLFRYITGANIQSQKIAMTTPVLVDTESEGNTMSFILPASMAIADAPESSAKNVTVRSLPAARYAVLRFAHGNDFAAREAAVARLQEWVQSEKLQQKGTPFYGFYDPPWTPGFLRRNEVLLSVEK